MLRTELLPNGMNEIYEPNFVRFVPPGNALNVIWGVKVPLTVVFTTPSNLITVLADVDVLFTTPPANDSKYTISCALETVPTATDKFSAQNDIVGAVAEYVKPIAVV
jgi:hypothetical protein